MLITAYLLTMQCSFSACSLSMFCTLPSDIAEIPENIKFCTSLERLDFGGNPLTK